MKKIILLSTSLFLMSCDGGIASLFPKLLMSSNLMSVNVGTSININWSGENINDCFASGAWAGSKDISGSENILIEKGGPNEFSISCKDLSGNKFQETLIVNGEKIFSGRVIDGYIRGATVYIDQNNNLELDETEQYTNTDNEGFFELTFKQGVLVSEGGIDLITGNLVDNLALTLPLYHYNEFLMVTPLTSLRMHFNKPSNLNLALGIDNNIDLSELDPEAMKNVDQVYSYIYEKGNQIAILAMGMHAFMSDNSYGNELTHDAFFSIATVLENEYINNQQRVDFESPQFIEDVIDYYVDDHFNKNPDINIDKFAVSKMKQVMSSFIPMIELKNDDYVTSAIFDFSTSTFLSDLRDLRNGINVDKIINAYEENMALYLSSNKNIDINNLDPNAKLDFTNLLSVSDKNNQTLVNDPSSSDTRIFKTSYSLNSMDETQPIQLANLRNENGLIYSDIIVDPSVYGYESLSSFEIRVKSGQGVIFDSDSIRIDQLGYNMNNLTTDNGLKSVWVSPLTKNSLDQGKVGVLAFAIDSSRGDSNQLIFETNLVGGTKDDFESQESGLTKNVFLLTASHSLADTYQ